MFGFAKNERDNIDADELKLLKQLAAAWMGMDDSAIEDAKKQGELVGIYCGKQETA